MDDSKEILNLLRVINEKVDTIDGRLDNIEKDISEIRGDIEKIKKFVALDNANFKISVREHLKPKS